MKYDELKPECKIPMASNNFWAAFHEVIGAISILIGLAALVWLIVSKTDIQVIAIVFAIFFGGGLSCLFMGDMIAKFHVIEHYSRQSARQAALTNAILLKSHNAEYAHPIIKNENPTIANENPIEEEPGDKTAEGFWGKD